MLQEKYEYKPLFLLGLAKNILAQPDFVNLNSAQNCRLIPRAAPDTQTAMEYRISNPHFAVIGCSESQRSIHQKLKNLASKNEYLTKRVSELEARNIRIQAANLRTAALRKYKGAGSQISEPKQKGNELIASELDIYAFRMDEQSLIVQSRGSLYGSGLVFLRNSKVGDSSFPFERF